MIEHEKLLSDLIAIKSYSGEEDEICNFAVDWFKKRGIESQVHDGNLILHRIGKDRNRAFIMNSHMDTVNSGDKDWKFGPWIPTKEDQKLVGLGASDMKSGMAASMLLANKIFNGDTPPVDFWFTYVVKEEIDGSGTQNFAEWFVKQNDFKRYQDMAGIFTEPTGLSEIEHGHRGNMFLKVTAFGDSGHGSRPSELKKHSVREMIGFSDILQVAFEKWSQEFSGSQFKPPTLGEMTSIHAGVIVKSLGEETTIEVASANKFPTVCVATFDVRTTPDFHKVAFERIVDLGQEQGIKVEYAFPPAPAGFTDPSEKIIKVTQNIVPDTKLTVSEGSADLGFLTSNGVKAIIFGPGEKNQCHVVDEFVYLDKIPQAVNIYNQIAEAWSK